MVWELMGVGEIEQGLPKKQWGDVSRKEAVTEKINLARERGEKRNTLKGGMGKGEAGKDLRSLGPYLKLTRKGLRSKPGLWW